MKRHEPVPVPFILCTLVYRFGLMLIWGLGVPFACVGSQKQSLLQKSFLKFFLIVSFTSVGSNSVHIL